MKDKVAIVALAVLMTGCAQMSGYRPTVDVQYDKNAYRLQQDMAECEVLAKQAAGTAKDIAMGAGTGALVGAAGGAAIGAVVGNPATGAALGSIAGLGTGAYSGVTADSRYRMAYKNCLIGRGHNPL